ncbi:Protein-L-isoaspartate O-methyltransferase [bacterium HR40]|nr:Protein-L-isoaspartate O-methyltransferase [bacterium HR40]
MQMQERHFAILRRHMVEVIEIYAELSGEELGKDRIDPRVLEAMLRVPRHEFVPEVLRPFAYNNSPLPIGFDKTISQPFIVAVMTDLLELQPTHKVLEVGTGLGYHAAVLAQLVERVWTVEIIEELAEEASTRLSLLGYHNIAIRVGDGAQGWPEHAPFDRILVTAGAPRVPEALFAQLAPGGRLVLPAGTPDDQRLTVVEKTRDGHARSRSVMPVRFGELETVR